MALRKGWVEPGVNFHKNSDIAAPIHDVADALTRILKPDRKLISAVRVGGGKIEEIIDLPLADDAVATTVAKPVRGCPPTDFEQAELRARDVLREFLTPQQLADFERHNKFIAIGADTGHRYMITSREARDEIALYHRSYYDLDQKLPLCAHDWTVPAAEEMLALLICTVTPGNETMLRQLRPH